MYLRGSQWFNFWTKGCCYMYSKDLLHIAFLQCNRFIKQPIWEYSYGLDDAFLSRLQGPSVGPQLVFAYLLGNLKSSKANSIDGHLSTGLYVYIARACDFLFLPLVYTTQATRCNIMEGNFKFSNVNKAIVGHVVVWLTAQLPRNTFSVLFGCHGVSTLDHC